MPKEPETVRLTLQARRQTHADQRAADAAAVSAMDSVALAQAAGLLCQARRQFTETDAPSCDWTCVAPAADAADIAPEVVSLARRTLARHAAPYMDDDGNLPDDAARDVYDRAVKDALNLAVCGYIARYR